MDEFTFYQELPLNFDTHNTNVKVEPIVQSYKKEYSGQLL